MRCAWRGMATFLGAFNLFLAVVLIVSAWGDSQSLASPVVLSQKGGCRCGQPAQKTRGGDKPHVRIAISVASQDRPFASIYKLIFASIYSTNPSFPVPSYPMTLLNFIHRSIRDTCDMFLIFFQIGKHS